MIKKQNKNLTKKSSKKKIMLLLSALVVVAIGGGVLALNNYNHNIGKGKEVSTEKTNRSTKDDIIANALDAAEKYPTQKNLSAVKNIIAKEKDKSKVKEEQAKLEVLNNRVSLERAANTAITDYQKTPTDENKYNIAKSAIDKLTGPTSQSIKNSQIKTINYIKDHANKSPQEMAQEIVKSNAKTGESNKTK